MLIRRATPADCEILLDRWLRSVRATHTFVSAEDVRAMTPHVRNYLSSSESELDEQGRPYPLLHMRLVATERL
jgi:putative acetyltransferase